MIRNPAAASIFAIISGKVLGWAAATDVSDRCVYRGVIEHSIYICVHPDAQRRGIGAALIAALIGSAEAGGIWTIQTGIYIGRQHRRPGGARPLGEG